MLLDGILRRLTDTFAGVLNLSARGGSASSNYLAWRKRAADNVFTLPINLFLLADNIGLLDINLIIKPYLNLL